MNRVTSCLCVVLMFVGCDASDPYTAHLAVDPSSESCGQCHATEYAAWSESPHGRSSESPVFRALVQEARSSWGDNAADRCVGCHAPGHDGSDRVGCVSCHMAIGNRGTRDGLLIVALDGAIASPHPPSPTNPPPHHTRRGDFLASSTLCGTCHEVTGPEHFVEHTYSEFTASSEAASGLTCQGCHMPYNHGRVDHGLASITPAWGRSQPLRDDRREAARVLVASAMTLTLEHRDDGVEVALTNTFGGHAIPTGATLVRELWVEVHTADTIFEHVLALGATMVADGVEVPLATEAETVSVAALMSGETLAHTVPIATPAEAILYLRPVRVDAALALGLDPAMPELAPIEVLRTRLD